MPRREVRREGAEEHDVRSVGRSVGRRPRSVALGYARCVLSSQEFRVAVPLSLPSPPPRRLIRRRRRRRRQRRRRRRPAGATPNELTSRASALRVALRKKRAAG